MWITALLASSVVFAARGDQPHLSRSDRALIAETNRLVGAVGDDIWPGWSDVPRPILLITQETEFAIGFPSALDGFSPLEGAPIGDATIQWRDREFEQALSASFPFMGHPAVVIASAELQEASPVAWVLTCAHEMFHVLQMHRGEYDKVAALEIGPKDDAMWQLEFPFPYTDDTTMQLMHLRVYPLFLAATGHDAAYNIGVSIEADEVLREHLLRLTGDDRAYDYMRFQEWKEGVARYTERELCRRAAESDATPADAFIDLAGEMTYAEHWSETSEGQLQVTKHVGRTARSRTSFYYSGLATACALDASSPGWRERYFEPTTWLDSMLHAP
jgi:hypothetical protein